MKFLLSRDYCLATRVCCIICYEHKYMRTEMILFNLFSLRECGSTDEICSLWSCKQCASPSDYGPKWLAPQVLIVINPPCQVRHLLLERRL